MNRNYQRRCIGVLCIVGGVCFLGEQFGFWDVSIFFPGWWTLFFILPAVFHMMEDGVRFGNTCMLLIGVYFLLDANGWLSFRLTFTSLAAISCVLIGVRLVFGSIGLHKYTNEKNKTCKDIHENVVFGSRRMRSSGCINSVDIQCFMGSHFVDLSNADLRNAQYIRLQATMGSIDIIVNSEMNFVVKKDNMLGSCDIQDEPLGKFDVYIDVSTMLGSVNLRKKKMSRYQEGECKEK